MEKRFNLIDEPWIPVSDRQNTEKQVSLSGIFREEGLRTLLGNPIQKIAVFKLLLAIVQAAKTPGNESEWLEWGTEGMARDALNYLQSNYQKFWLYGDEAFLQMPDIQYVGKKEIKPYSLALPYIPTGNTTVFKQSHQAQAMDDAEKALLLVWLIGCAFSGKKADSTAILSDSYTKGKTAKTGALLGGYGYLHTFLQGDSILQSIWFNVVTAEEVKREFSVYAHGLGRPPWEKMPKSEDDATAEILKETYIGRLIPLSRFIYFIEEGIYYAEGIIYPNHLEGGIDGSVTMLVGKDVKKRKAIWTRTSKRPWRELTALLSFLHTEQGQGFDCPLLRIALQRIRGIRWESDISVWSGGLCTSSNAGEQYVSGSDDYVESQFTFEPYSLGGSNFNTFCNVMEGLEHVAKRVYTSVLMYYKTLQADGKKQASQASEQFWQDSELIAQEMMDTCFSDNDDKEDALKELRKRYASYAERIYDVHSPKETARQLDAWAKCRTSYWKYINENKIK